MTQRFSRLRGPVVHLSAISLQDVSYYYSRHRQVLGPTTGRKAGVNLSAG